MTCSSACSRQLGRVRGGATGLRKLTFSIAHARMVDEYRARQRRPTTLRWTAEDDARHEPSAEQHAEVNESTRRVMQMLDRLPPDQREVLVLRILGDLTSSRSPRSWAAAAAR